MPSIANPYLFLIYDEESAEGGFLMFNDIRSFIILTKKFLLVFASRFDLMMLFNLRDAFKYIWQLSSVTTPVKLVFVLYR